MQRTPLDYRNRVELQVETDAVWVEELLVFVVVAINVAL